MAKVTWRTADSPDDPIFSRSFVISSRNLPPESKRLKPSSPTNTAGQGIPSLTQSTEKAKNPNK